MKSQKEITEILAAYDATKSVLSAAKLVACDPRTVRRYVAARDVRPWIAEPGLWLQFGWGQGPLVPGPDGHPQRTALFCAWPAWSRFWQVIPCRDRKQAALMEGLDTALRRLGGVPAYLLSRVSPGASDHPALDAIGGYYGTQVRACVPEPVPVGRCASSCIRIAAADWVPTVLQLPRRLPSFDALRSACADLTERANRTACPGSSQGETPYDRLTVERPRLRPLPITPVHLGLARASR